MPESRFLEGRVVAKSSRGWKVVADDGSKWEFEDPRWVSAEERPAPRLSDRVRLEVAPKERQPLRVWFVAGEHPEPTTVPLPPESHRPEAAFPTYQRPPQRTPATGFLNPYNFVRPLPRPTGMRRGVPDVALLGRCPAPPLDRYLGLSGTIECGIEAETAVFVSDSNGVEFDELEAGRKHDKVRFFRDADGKPSIPGSTLRGVVRSVFEAATSSCWEHVADARHGRRWTARDAKVLVPGQLLRTEDGWSFRMLGGTSGFRPDGPTGPMYAACVLRHRPRANGRTAPPIPGWLEHGTECFARIRLHDHQRFRYWSVERFGTDEPSVTDATVDRDNVRVVNGFYVENGRNIERKHDERFFFSDPSSRDPHPTVPIGDAEAIQRYVDLLDTYRERYREAGPRQDGLEDSRYATEGPSTPAECDGELVYAWIEREERDLVVRSLAPAAVPRLLYASTTTARFPDLESVEACSPLNARVPGHLRLCPACRVFGWVARGRTGDVAQGAVRSRVRFGEARFDPATDLVREPHTLLVLSSPKPSAIRMYLLRSAGDLRPQLDEKQVDYDRDGMVLRGRKMYRRQSEAKLTPDASPSDQNRTIVDHLRPGASTTFEIRFDNLAPVELGALLWALEMEDSTWKHRVGFAKPLGLGCVRIDVKQLRLLASSRYDAEGAAESEPRSGGARPLVDALKARFRRAMEERYAPSAGAADFLGLANIADLRGLLADAPRLPVSYPRLPEYQDVEGVESVQWFVVNRGGRYHEEYGRGHWLDVADADAGLPRDPTVI